MNNRSNVPAIISYITWIGFLVAMFMRDPTDGFTAHHMNQALVLNLVSIAGGLLNIIPILGNMAAAVISIAVLAADILGIYRAAKGSTEPIPVIGDIHIIG
jgi:uncharacterized membrane protein